MKHKIFVVSHCFLNEGSKLKNQNPSDQIQERRRKREFLTRFLSQDIGIIQLPCPEQIIYGCNRWGHAASQFNTPHFRKESRRMLEDIVGQLVEYYSFPDRFQVMGIVGINGSPSCGINFTYDGQWGGELGKNQDISALLSSLKKVDKAGVFMEVLREMLLERNLYIPFYSLETLNYEELEACELSE